MSMYQTPERMSLKQKAIPIPDLMGKSVLDVGTEHGWWARNAVELGAAQVVGLDRNRDVEATHHIDLGKQWREYGKFDVIYMFSLYHHIYQSTGGDHLPIWYWLSRHLKQDGVLLWENPTGTDDPVVCKDVSQEYRSGYNVGAIIGTALEYFDSEHIGPALHVTTREVYRFKLKPVFIETLRGTVSSGAGGATKAFNYADGRRMKVLKELLGEQMFPGTLNVKCESPFWWERDYYRGQVWDVKDRRAGLDSEWALRWARFYPVSVNGIDAWAFRCEGERYPDNFVELISKDRLRDKIKSEVTIDGK